MSKLKIPPKSYFQKIKKILYEEILPDIKNREFNNVRRAIYSNAKILDLMAKNGIYLNEISSGVSDRKAYKGYIKQIISDFKRNRYYRDYYPSKGNLEARRALCIRENYKLVAKNRYTPEDFCLAEGSTGAITMIFEYLSKYAPRGEILIQSPNYYLYKFVSNYYGLRLREIMPELGRKDVSFISADTIVKNITDKTKVIVITNPANPSGEILERNGLEKILKAAKERNLLVLIDELFSELVFSQKTFTAADLVASQLDTMENLVIVKGYSKSKNLVGLRIGYLYSKNKDLLNGVALIAQQRSSYSVASNFTGLICLDSFIQSVRFNGYKKINKVLADFKELPSIAEKSEAELYKNYNNYEKYFGQLMAFYSQRYDDIIKILGNDIEKSFPKYSAFNTIVKIREIGNVNSFDFMVNCFLTTGLKTEIAPCFGFDQRTWDTKLGFWLRLTFAKDKKLFKKGLEAFRDYKKYYLSSNKYFLNTGLSF